ncbi:MAG TPA: AAA family ATPase [Acidimicrobiia bacterium]|nr:AAA family ATPase [Acidimicrobiia bacterium]
MLSEGPSHRRPTVLFCDLVDSSRIAEQLDDEQFWHVVLNFQDACNQVVDRFDGYIYKSLGDGLVVLFGLPLAHEDDARRAVHTGLGVVEAVRGLGPMLQEKYGVTLSVRVGVHTGPVVVGKVRGVTEITGSTPALASRIQDIAEPDSVLISRDTAELVAGYFALESKGEVPVRGMSKPVELLKVIAPTGAESRLEAQTGALTPMVDREAELRQLADLWSAVKAGEGRAVLIRGEAGIGKSRVARHLRDLSARTGGSPLQGSCSPYHTSTAFHPLARMLSRRLGVAADADDRQRLELLETEMLAARLDPAATVPFLAPLLSIEMDPAGPYVPPRLDASKLRDTTIEVLKSWWSRLAAADPQLVLIEDLHWAEPSTLELLERVINDPSSGLLLVTTARPEFPGWESSAGLTIVELAPLTLPDRHHMIQSIGPANLTETVVEEIAHRSDGVPLFVEELLRSMSDRGGNGGRVVPNSLRDMLMSRLEAAGPDLRVAQAAAVIGNRINLELLRDVTEIEEGDLLQTLDSLAASGVLGVQGVGSDRRYTFRHSLIRDAAYESQLPETAQVVHSRVADALIGRLGDPTPADRGVIALHLDEAGRTEDAVGFYLGAAQAAQATGAYEEALSKLDRALALVIGWPAGEPRTLTELLVRMLKAASLVATTGYGSEAARAEFEQALELSAALGSRPESVGVQLAIMAYDTARGLRDEAGSIIDRLTARLAGASADEVMLYGPEVTVSDALHRYGLGDYRGSRRQLDRAIEMFRDRPPGFTSPLWTLPNSPLVATYAQLIPVLWIQGERRRAIEAAGTALELSRELEFPAGPFSEAYSRAFIGYMYQLEGDWAKAASEFRAVTALGNDHGFAMWEGLGSIHAMIAAAYLEATPEVVARIGDARRQLDQLGIAAFQPYFATSEAELRAEVGDIDQALGLFEEAVDLSERLQERHYLAETLRKHARVVAAQPDAPPGAVAALLSQALATAQEQGALLFQLRAAIDVHRLLPLSARPPEAAQALSSEVLDPLTADYPEAAQAAELLTASSP